MEKGDEKRFWRRRRDSNPRYAFGAYNGLANRRLQPIGHVSAVRPYLYFWALRVNWRENRRNGGRCDIVSIQNDGSGGENCPPASALGRLTKNRAALTRRSYGISKRPRPLQELLSFARSAPSASSWQRSSWRSEVDPGFGTRGLIGNGPFRC